MINVNHNKLHPGVIYADVREAEEAFMKDYSELIMMTWSAYKTAIECGYAEDAEGSVQFDVVGINISGKEHTAHYRNDTETVIFEMKE